ncbi:Cysteine protease ATG4 [Verticillium dahliae VDG1]|nr:Cysteine protease ATG4 [Verticillium dahliae VDG1]
MRSRRASGPDTPRPIFLAGPETGFDAEVKPGPASPGLLHKINRQWNELLAQARRTSGHGRTIVEEERRREVLKGKIKVLNDGAQV